MKYDFIVGLLCGSIITVVLQSIPETLPFWRKLEIVLLVCNACAFVCVALDRWKDR
jgi:hypothetical protein